MILQLLYKLATSFRKAIEHCERKRLPITFQDFPSGACGDANLLLAEFLHSKGHGPFQYIYGVCYRGDESFSHAWIKWDEIIVDITADQFPDIVQPAVVTRDLIWYQQFDIDGYHKADYRIYDPYTVSVLSNAYTLIMQQIEIP